MIYGRIVGNSTIFYLSVVGTVLYSCYSTTMMILRKFYYRIFFFYLLMILEVSHKKKIYITIS